MDIGPDEGFAPEKDIFGRKKMGEHLTNLVKNLEGPTVMLLDAPWGAGKTTFVKMWRGHLKQAGIPSIYFDAFANDYQEDAFLALAAEVIAAAEDLKLPEEKSLEAFKDKAVDAAKAVLKIGLRLGLRTVTAGVLSGNEIEEGNRAFSDALVTSTGDDAANSLDTILRKRLESPTADRLAFASFGKALSDIASTMARNEEDAKKKPLVFIIDELDRCRPTFSLAVIERIKHFFSVDGVVFVIVTNVNQLEKSVTHTYGDVDAKTYLQKFFHIKASLDAGDNLTQHGASIKYLNHLFRYVIPKDNGNRFSEDIKEMISMVAVARDLSLRAIERVCANVAIAIASTRNLSEAYSPIIGVLCVIKEVDGTLFAKAMAGKVSFDEICDAMMFEKWTRYNGKKENTDIIQNWWRYVTEEESLDQEWRARIGSILFHYSDDPRSLVKYSAKLVNVASFVHPD
ncbi:MAG: hypothetical protein VR70_15940 [Rhodospirillaceae bacterium BRH_c57]|nr:MAG: hypothetical protein VR70_15940 [Rhodospirillaceae bacterium BRH_c57]